MLLSFKMRTDRNLAKGSWTKSKIIPLLFPFNFFSFIWSSVSCSLSNSFCNICANNSSSVVFDNVVSIPEAANNFKGSTSSSTATFVDLYVKNNNKGFQSTLWSQNNLSMWRVKGKQGKSSFKRMLSQEWYLNWRVIFLEQIHTLCSKVSLINILYSTNMRALKDGIKLCSTNLHVHRCKIQNILIVYPSFSFSCNWLANCSLITSCKEHTDTGPVGLAQGEDIIKFSVQLKRNLVTQWIFIF